MAENSEPENDSIFLWVRYQPEEVNEGYWLAFLYQRLVLLLVLAYAWSAAIAFGYVQCALFPDIKDFFQAEFLPVLLISVVGIPLTVCAILWILMRSRVAKSFYIRPNFHFPMLYVLDKDGIRMQFASGSGLIEWRYFNLLIETGSNFALVSTPKEVFVLPKRCFASWAEVDSARSLLCSHIRSYKKVGRENREIVFGKQAITSVIIDGEEYPVPEMLAERMPSAGETESGADVIRNTESENGGESTSCAPTGVVDGGVADAGVESGSATKEPGAISKLEPGSTTIGPVTTKLEPGSTAIEPAASAKTDHDLGSGLVADCTYITGEIKEAQRIYFFRKILPRLGLVYLALGIGAPLLTTMLGLLWNVPDLNEMIWGRDMHVIMIIVPLYLIQAWSFYRRTVRTPDSDKFKSTVGFSFNSAGCSMRTGEHYSMLAWLHFVECWETETQFMLLFGSGGRAMYVIPKRIFDDAQKAQLKNLLEKNVRRYKVLM